MKRLAAAARPANDAFPFLSNIHNFCLVSTAWPSFDSIQA